MRSLSPIFIFCLLLLSGCISVDHAETISQQDTQRVTWRMVLSQEADGTVLEGEKETLFEAVRAGKEVRVYWRSTRVEHLVAAHFLTIYEGELFAQPKQIVGQRPSVEADGPQISLAESGTKWTAIISTNGRFPYPVKWFVQD